MSTPVAGPLATVPLHVAAGDIAVWWDDAGGTWESVPLGSGPGTGGGTVTSINTGTGLLGGPITATGTIALQVPVTISHGGTNATALPFSAPPVNAVWGQMSTLLATDGTTIMPAAGLNGTIGFDSNGNLSCFGNTTQPPYYNLARYNGTVGSPTALLSGDILGSLQWDGIVSAGNWDAGSRALIRVTATENWSATANGTRMNFWTTPTGSTTTVVALSLNAGVAVGNPTGGDMGLGSINVAGNYYRNGVVIGATGPPGPPGPTGPTGATGATGAANITGLTTGQLGIAGSATSLTSSIAYGTTGNNTIVETGATGLLAAGVMPAYTGDVTSPAGSTVTTVTGLQTRAISATAPTSNQVLQWNGTVWGPATLGTGGTITAVTAGTGLSGGGTTGAVTLNLSTPVAVANGGTGASTAPTALTSLGAAPILSPTFVGKVTTVASAAGRASLTMPHGVAPTAPVNGDMWTTSAGGLFAYINGATVGPYIAGNQTITLSGDASGSGTTTIPVTLATVTVPKGGTGATTLPLPTLANAGAGFTGAVLLGAGTGAVVAHDVWGSFGAGAGYLAGYVASNTVYPVLSMGRAGGTPASPAAINSGAQLGVIDAEGWTGSAFSGGGSLQFAASENWSTSAWGTRVLVSAITPGTTTMVTRLTVGPGVQVGAPTGGDKGAGTLNATQVYANNVLLTSDAALKEGIAPLPECLPWVTAIEPKSFRWKPGEEEAPAPPGHFDQTNMGFIAQEVAAVLGGKNDAVDLSAMVAVLWKAVREMSDKIKALETAYEL